MMGVFYVPMMYVQCVRPIASEVFGVLLAILGSIVMYQDGSAERVDGVEPKFTDYLVALLGSFSGACFFFVSNLKMKQMPLAIMLFLMSVYGIFV